MDILPFILSWPWVVFLAVMAVLGVSGAVIGLAVRHVRWRRASVRMLTIVGVLLVLFSMFLQVAMYVPGGASVYEARQMVLLGCVVAALASFVAAYVVSRRAKEAEKA